MRRPALFFENLPKLKTKLDTLYEVGLGYVTLGQSSTTLSGGEAQRVKLATELSRRSTGSTVYILDEPTTGLHMADVHKLISIIDRLADAGNTVVIIEHNLDVIKTADYIIDLGPEGGDGSGTLVFAGTPEECAACTDSYTGQFLKKNALTHPHLSRKMKRRGSHDGIHSRGLCRGSGAVADNLVCKGTSAHAGEARQEHKSKCAADGERSRAYAGYTLRSLVWLRENGTLKAEIDIKAIDTDDETRSILRRFEAQYRFVNYTEEISDDAGIKRN